jgi:hypothetical protein
MGRAVIFQDFFLAGGEAVLQGYFEKMSVFVWCFCG